MSEEISRTILKENLEIALRMAIFKQAKDEEIIGYDRGSTLLEGWRNSLRGLQKYGTLIIKD